MIAFSTYKLTLKDNKMLNDMLQNTINRNNAQNIEYIKYQCIYK